MLSSVSFFSLSSITKTDTKPLPKTKTTKPTVHSSLFSCLECRQIDMNCSVEISVPQFGWLNREHPYINTKSTNTYINITTTKYSMKIWIRREAPHIQEKNCCEAIDIQILPNSASKFWRKMPTIKGAFDGLLNYTESRENYAVPGVSLLPKQQPSSNTNNKISFWLVHNDERNPFASRFHWGCYTGPGTFRISL